MSDMDEKQFETTGLEVENTARTSVMMELWEKTKKTVVDLKESEEFKGMTKEQKEIALRGVALVTLAVLELVPVGNLAGEGTKLYALLAKAAEKVPDIKKAGAVGGLIPDLYPDLPPWLVKGLTAVGLVPGLGAATEILQLMVDQYWNNPKNQLKMGKEVAEAIKNNFFDKSEYAQQQINEAQLAFVDEEGN